VAYSLKSKPIIIKYTGILAPILMKLKTVSFRVLGTLINGTNGINSDVSVRPVFVAGIKEYRRTVIAALRHQSQRVWFRWLYMAFSQYMWVNEWERIPAIADKMS
jgi:N-acetylglucosaminylphosphatidylinositol deacetylase